MAQTGGTRQKYPELKSGDLATLAIRRMESDLPWYRLLKADERSWVNLVAQRGISDFLEWLADPSEHRKIASDVFGSAPQELTRSITLEQTVDLVRLTIAVVEEFVANLDDSIKFAILKYSREIAFATALVYARAAEARGAWDTRLEALVVDAVLRGEVDAPLLSRAAALGWEGKSPVSVIVGPRPSDDPSRAAESMRRYAKHAKLDLLSGVVGARMLVIIGGSRDPLGVARQLANVFAPGPLVSGPVVANLSECNSSASAAVAGIDAIQAWPGAPRPVAAQDLLPERALNGDPQAKDHLIHEIYEKLNETGGELLETIDALVTYGGVEPASRGMFVHANTVRYRMRRITELTDLSPMEPRELYVLNVALSMGRLSER